MQHEPHAFANTQRTYQSTNEWMNDQAELSRDEFMIHDI